MMPVKVAAVIAVLVWLPVSVRAGEDKLPAQTADALKRACDYFRKQIAVEGTYVWRYSKDLQQREGEREASATMAWVQPPGTPSVGLAYLNAYHNTGDRYLLDAASETARGLIRGQLASGGWDYRIYFEPVRRKRFAYRVDGEPTRGAFNTTTLDDNNTQECIRFLMRLDKTLKFKEADIHDAAAFALDSLLRAQYPNGAWPQRYNAFPDPKKFPVKKASYPKTWSRTFPAVNYNAHYTLNDNSLEDMIDVMLEAGVIYGDKKYTQAARRGGDFLLLAQMPEPQPVWAQQYDVDMHPAWARKFEPPAVTGGESFGAMNALLMLYRATGDKKYLEPIPRALAFFRKVKLKDGRLARFYELRTSKPLYFTRDYKLTYSDADMPTHYGFKVGDRSDRIARQYEQLIKNGPPRPSTPSGKVSPPSARQKMQVQQIIAALDGQGRWLESGTLRSAGKESQAILTTQTFIRNVQTLSSYLRYYAKK